MKTRILKIVVLLISVEVQAQNELYINNAVLHINNALIHINGSMINANGSTLTNNGTIELTGDLTNEASVNFNDGVLIFNGGGNQTLNGSVPFSANNIVLNNPSGITLNNTLKVNGTFDFVNGLINAPTTSPLWFTENGLVTGVSDASHVLGYVGREGIGNFSYPVGDSSKYQKVDVNTSLNTAGIVVNYSGSDAGNATFSSAGTENTALKAYNKNEYWEIKPVSSATGTVTIYWDGYKDDFNAPTSDRKVAHKYDETWLNEGTTGTGSITSGSITSNSISTWDYFTLGSINPLGIFTPNSKGNLTIYPNPVTDVLYIEGTSKGGTITLTDVQGKILKQTKAMDNKATIDLHQFAPGVYFIYTQNGMEQKVVKQ